MSRHTESEVAELLWAKAIAIHGRILSNGTRDDSVSSLVTSQLQIFEALRERGYLLTETRSTA